MNLKMIPVLVAYNNMLAKVSNCLFQIGNIIVDLYSQQYNALSGNVIK